MNYFAHGLAFLDRPYLLAGTAVPDWLLVADRQVRLRRRHLIPWVGADGHGVAEVARGILQHLTDDAHFHHLPAFGSLWLELSHRIRETLRAEPGVYTALVAHLLLELLLDATLIQEVPDRLEEYYRVLDTLDVDRVQEAVNQMGARQTLRLAPMIVEFRRLRVLWDYLEDGKLWERLNQVMRRLGSAELPESFQDLLPWARQAVAQKKDQLLEGIPAPVDL